MDVESFLFAGQEDIEVDFPTKIISEQDQPVLLA
jgi:hypothetical protein